MRRLPNGRVGRVLMGAAVLAVLAAACSTKTPTAPVQTPAPVISAVVANFTCAVTGLQVQFFDLSSGNPTSWSWTFGDGGKSSKQDPIHKYKEPVLSDYLVTLKVTKAGEPAATSQAFLSQVTSTTGGNCLPQGEVIVEPAT